ncbi:MAG: hypothetical protein R2845_12485 [Thermomicrobiales bacterium]
MVRIDSSAARTAGATVITGQHLLDLDPYIRSIVRDQPLLAIDRIRYTGEPVAIVLADSERSARGRCTGDDRGRSTSAGSHRSGVGSRVS